MEKSIADMHEKFCTILRMASDEEVISRVRRICEDKYARDATLHMLNLKPGDVYYDISADRTFMMVE